MIIQIVQWNEITERKKKLHHNSIIVSPYETHEDS